MRPELLPDVIIQFHFIGIKTKQKKTPNKKSPLSSDCVALFSPQKGLEKQVQPRTAIVTHDYYNKMVNWMQFELFWCTLSSSCPLSYTCKHSHDTYIFDTQILIHQFTGWRINPFKSLILVCKMCSSSIHNWHLFCGQKLLLAGERAGDSLSFQVNNSVQQCLQKWPNKLLL